MLSTNETTTRFWGSLSYLLTGALAGVSSRLKGSQPQAEQRPHRTPGSNKPRAGPPPSPPAAQTEEPLWSSVQKLEVMQTSGLGSCLGPFAKGERAAWGDAQAETPRKEQGGAERGRPGYCKPCPF